MDKVTPPLIYKLVHRLIVDSRSQASDSISSSTLLEKHRLDTGVSALLYRIPKE